MKNYTLTVTQEQLNVIAAALGNMPYNQSANVINIISAQVKEQEQPKQDGPPLSKVK